MIVNKLNVGSSDENQRETVMRKLARQVIKDSFQTMYDCFFKIFKER